MVILVQKSYRKNILRDLRGNLSRFLSLFGIVALGVMILTGLASFAPSMRIAGQKYYVQQNVFDLRVLSTLGLSEDDIDAIAATEGVTAVQPVKYLDAEGRWSSTDQPAVLRIQQLPADPGADTAENLNRPLLLAGRMPEADDECVVHVMGHGEEIPIGTTLTLPDGTDGLARTSYTVVGQVQDPLHFSSDQETSTAGDGVLDAIVYVPDGQLTAVYYTVCYIKAENADQYDNYYDEYQAAVDDVADRLTAISGAQCTTRRETLIDDATAKLADAKQTYDEQKAEAERQFAQAEQKLDEAEAQLTAAKAQLEQGEAEYTSGKAQLAQQKAALLLPRAPVAGKRIFLEYITPLWKHMSFSQKTTARNLFRYKKRFFMTVLGVAGCTALLLIGFGIQDSILPMLNRQTTELNHSDLTISYSDARAFSVEHGLGDVLDSSADVTSWGRFYNKSVTIYNASGDKQTVSIVTAEDESQMTAYFTFRTRQGHKAIPFDDSSAILTEKTAESLGLAVGDTFEVETSDGSRKTLTLTGITENYVFTRLYLSQAQLRTLTGGTLPEWNTVYGQTDCPTSDDRNTLRTDLLACNYVSGVSFMEDTTEMFDNLIGCLNYVVILIIVCAAALAAVVLYNLISVNLGERKKELATIKVLGFFDNEVYRYIFREIDLLALIGSLAGLALGVPLHQFIVRTVEMDQMMFIRSIAPRSYLFSVALTLFFTVVVCRLMRRHVRNISMVESMKAPE